MGVEFDGGTISANLGSYDRRARSWIAANCTRYASRAQSYARRGARWTDQTGNARNGLISRPFRRGNTFGLVVAGTVDYQIWLEVRWAGRYAIIRPTVQAIGPQLLGGIASGWASALGGK